MECPLPRASSAVGREQVTPGAGAGGYGAAGRRDLHPAAGCAQTRHRRRFVPEFGSSDRLRKVFARAWGVEKR